MCAMPRAIGSGAAPAPSDGKAGNQADAWRMDLGDRLDGAQQVAGGGFHQRLAPRAGLRGRSRLDRGDAIPGAIIFSRT